MTVRLDEFRHREGRDPSPKERAALEREASADTRGRKSGLGVVDLVSRWQGEAADAGWTVERLVEHVDGATAHRSPADSLTVTDVVAAVSSKLSSWGSADVVQAICDLHRPVSQMSGHRWAAAIERAADRILERCVDLDPANATRRRESDGRSLWIEPTAPRFTSEAVLVEEERILTWAMDAQAVPASTSRTVDRSSLDVLQADAAASVAGGGPSRVSGRPGRCRQDPDARRRRQRPARPASRRRSASPRRRKRPGCWSVTPGCAPTPSPSCSTSGNAATDRHCPSTNSSRDDGGGRRGRHVVDAGAAPARQTRPRRTVGGSC